MTSPLAEHQKKLANLSIVLGSLYVGAAAIFLFGVFAAASVRRLLTALIYVSQIPYATRVETIGLHPHILLPVCRGGHHHNCVWFSTDDCSLYTQGNDTVSPGIVDFRFD